MLSQLTCVNVDTASFLGLDQRDENIFSLPVTPDVCSGFGRVFGGCALAAGVYAMETVSGRRASWAVGQFISYAEPPEELIFRVDELASGGRTSQLRVVGSVGEREVIGIMGSVGSTSSSDSAVTETGVWVEPPTVASPLDCPERTYRTGPSTSISSRFEQRLAIGRMPDDPPVDDGRSALWCRLSNGVSPDAGLLAVLGDYVPFGAGQVLDVPVSSISLDNTIRFADLSPTEWVLLDIRIDNVTGGYAHGNVHLWTDGGVLLATASQTAQLRRWRS